MDMRVFLTMLLSVIASGCVHKPSSAEIGALPAPVTESGYRLQHEGMDEIRALIIAQDAVRMNDSWIDSAEFGAPHQQSDGSWSVLMWRLPKSPGGHRLILIDHMGRVTAYVRGA